MRICDICYAEIKGKEDMCDECRQRRPAKELKEENVPDEEIIERFKELMVLRTENIELLTDKLRSMSRKYDVL